ncbi:MAG: DUF3307 domain-containing protein [Gammaproteobacteria bacterium]|nr:MAG: DUF3307 domain-containing protein [Gammaproteobacteria bacterium]
MTPVDVLLALVLFQLKHYLADFHWQTIWIVQTKGRYGHPGGLIHAGLHGLLSLPVLLLVAPFAPVLFTVILIFEMVLHYHIDWIKARVVSQRGIDERDSAYWHYLGLDQAAHQLTYVAMLAALII